jgi:hypothetical protein
MYLNIIQWVEQDVSQNGWEKQNENITMIHPFKLDSYSFPQNNTTYLKMPIADTHAKTLSSLVPVRVPVEEWARSSITRSDILSLSWLEGRIDRPKCLPCTSISYRRSRRRQRRRGLVLPPLRRERWSHHGPFLIDGMSEREMSGQEAPHYYGHWLNYVPTFLFIFRHHFFCCSL